MNTEQKTTFEGRLLGTGKETSTVVWEALKPLKCTKCGAKILAGTLFTKTGKPQTPHCRNCRSFTTR